MEDHHHHYANMADLRHLITPTRPPSHFPAANPFAAAGHRNLPFEFMPPPIPLHDFVTIDHSHNATTSTTTGAGASGGAAISSSTSLCGGFEVDVGGTCRWPRQETLTLLDIRSRLDPKFKEANLKGPLWDEVSSIMSEEHGYQRSGKKCREKFENLYKYYKKTKEGKAGRQDGKHYRFFRQLEALYGEPTTNNVVSTTSMSFHSMNPPNHQDHIPKLSDSLSLSNSSEFDSSSSEEDKDGSDDRIRTRRRRGWKANIKDFIDTQMEKLVKKQEAWVEKMMRTMEQKEQERAMREEQWRNEEAKRIERELKQWAKERAWIESRDAALFEMLEKINGGEGFEGSSPNENIKGRDEGLGFKVEAGNENIKGIEQGLELRVEAGIDQGLRFRVEGENENTKGIDDGQHDWPEPEITRLIQLKSSLESRLHHSRSEELLWDEVGAKMACCGYERSATMCKEKWEAINYYLVKKTKECYNKKRDEDSRTSSSSNYNFQGQGGGAYCGMINEGGPDRTARIQPSNDGSSPSSSNAGNMVQDSCFRFLMGDGDQHGLWETYGLKLNNGENQ